MLNPHRHHDDAERPEDRPGQRVVNKEQEIEWDDGSVWFISWFSDHGGFYADRWFFEDEPDDDETHELVDDETPPEPPCPTSYVPQEGVFASLDAVEAAMGEPLPAAVRAELERQAAAHPCTCRDAWGVAFATEVHHLLADGTLVTTWAPPWADDPLDPTWDLDCCGSSPHIHASHHHDPTEG